MPVRLATPADAVSLVELERAASFHPWSLAQVIQSCRHECQQVLVFETEALECGGFAVLDVVAGEVSLLNIAVHPNHQGSGFGNALMEKAILVARESMQGRRMLLEVRVSNTIAIALYRKYGFGEDGVRKNYYPTVASREDALLMSLALEKIQ
jgi:ribosomal-protein-alanine N-acetyltransferase